jgi:hypothetical protein
MKSKKKLKLSRQVYMEDLQAIHNRVFEELQKRDIWFDSVTADNRFSKELSEFLEKTFDYPDYQNYN